MTLWLMLIGAALLLMRARMFNGVVFPVDTPRVTLMFGDTSPPWYSPSDPHLGVDVSPYPGAFGAPIYAPMRGRVTDLRDTYGGGHTFVIECEAPFDFTAADLSGTVRTVLKGELLSFRFCHCQEILVSEGDGVTAGELVATVGATGNYVSGAHLHHELRIGQYPGGTLLNPMHFYIASIVGLRDEVEHPYA